MRRGGKDKKRRRKCNNSSMEVGSESISTSFFFKQYKVQTLQIRLSASTVPAMMSQRFERTLECVAKSDKRLSCGVSSNAIKFESWCSRRGEGTSTRVEITPRIIFHLQYLSK